VNLVEMGVLIVLIKIFVSLVLKGLERMECGGKNLKN